MQNQWEAFDDDDEVEIPKTTSNPTRKIKKKLSAKKIPKYPNKPISAVNLIQRTLWFV